MSLRALAYVSHVVGPWDRMSLDGLIAKAAEFNSEADVTGVLLFDGHRFLQYLEGPEEGVDAAYHRVCISTSHSDLIVLSQGPLPRRLVPYWRLHGLLADPGQVRNVAHADWMGFIRSERRRERPRSAMEHLLSYLNPHVPA
jgi:hypothetical protein